MAAHLLILIALTLLTLSRSEILSYNNHEIDRASPEYLKIPKYAQKDVPNWHPGNGRSYVDLSDMQLVTACDGSDDPSCKEGATFEVLTFMETPDKGWMDYWPEHEFCCTSVNLDKGLCRESELGRLIVPINVPGAFAQSFELEPQSMLRFGDDPALSHHDIKVSGVYILIFASCGESAAPVLLNGKIDSMDPYGYLPADLFGNMPFFILLMCCYTLLAVYWSAVCLRHYDQMIPVQYWISVLLVMGMVETTAMYSHYEHWNFSGTASVGMLTTGLFFGIFKRTLSRITIVLLSLGYGIVKPSVGEDMQRVLQLGVAYFVVSFCYVLVTMFPAQHKQTGEGEDVDYLSLLVFFLAAIDTVFYVWIIQSINALLITLAARQQGLKYLLYRNFRAVLFLSLFCAAVWGLYCGIVIFDNTGANGSDQQWQRRWTVDALWELIYFIVLAAIAHMWAPTSNSQRYAYSVELTQLDDDQEYLQSGKSTILNTRRGEDEEEGDHLDAEYGGQLSDKDDPFGASNTGALDSASAISKKQ